MDRHVIALMSRSERGSLPMAMLLIMVGTMLASLLAPVVIRQITSTRDDVAAVNMIDAAQSGLDVAVSSIRSAATPAAVGLLGVIPAGLRASLKCTVGGVLAAGVGVSYSATIAYLTSDPVGHTSDLTWLTSHLLPCVAGVGLVTNPSYARITSVATQQTSRATSTRTMQATYVFARQTLTVASTPLPVGTNTPPGSALCMDSGAGLLGGFVNMVACAASVAQQFVLTANGLLQLASTASATAANQRCVDMNDATAALSVVSCLALATTGRTWVISGGLLLVAAAGVIVFAFCLAVAFFLLFLGGGGCGTGTPPPAAAQPLYPTSSSSQGGLKDIIEV